MQIVLIEEALPSDEISKIIEEFPQFLFLSYSPNDLATLTSKQWESVEILYGEYLSKEYLNMAPNLRWIHSPSPYIRNLCIEEIRKRGNILVTRTKQECEHQIAEYVLGGILHFSKYFDKWRGERSIWESPYRKDLWTLRGRIHTQIGLATAGTAIARRCREFSMTVRGVALTPSFHRYCDKTYPLEALVELVAETDTICLTIPDETAVKKWAPLSALHHLREGAILIILDPFACIDYDELAVIISERNLRGVLIDTSHYSPLSPDSAIWSAPRTIITPEISILPTSHEHAAFRSFRYNLSQYVHGNIIDMRNPVLD